MPSFAGSMNVSTVEAWQRIWWRNLLGSHQNIDALASLFFISITRWMWRWAVEKRLADWHIFIARSFVATWPAYVCAPKRTGIVHGKISERFIFTAGGTLPREIEIGAGYRYSCLGHRRPPIQVS